jgi:hypothetical protein
VPGAIILKVAKTLRHLVRRFACLLRDSLGSEVARVRVGFSSNLKNGRRYQMLRSGGVPAWLQLLGAQGNRKVCVSKSFWMNPASCRRAATTGRPNAWCVGELRRRIR